MNNETLLMILGAVGIYYLMTKNREGFKYAEDGANAVYAQPSFPAPPALRNTPPVPQFETLGQMTGDNLLAKKSTLSSNQVNQMLAQVCFFGYEVGEVSCPTRYFDEASSINFRRSMVYGWGVLRVALMYRLQKWGLLRSPIFG